MSRTMTYSDLLRLFGWQNPRDDSEVAARIWHIVAEIQVTI